MKLRYQIAVPCIILLLLCGCTESNDRPPELDTPPPAPLVGTYTGDYGTLIFASDGETVTAQFSQELSQAIEIEPNSAEYSYTFTWYSFGECRWDVATQLNLSSNCSDADFYFMINGSTKAVTRECITLSYFDGFDGMEFYLCEK